MGKRRRSDLLSATALIGAVVLAAACSGDDGGDGDPNASSGNAGEPGTNAGASGGSDDGLGGRATGSGATGSGAMGSGAMGGDATNGGGTNGGGTSGSISISLGGDDGIGLAGGSPGLGSCGGSPLDATFSPANILFVLDKSGSMDVNWTALEQAVSAAMVGDGASASYGLLLYPSNDSCGVGAGLDVAVQPSADAAGPIEDALTAVVPGGGTPTAAALSEALDYFYDEGSALAGDKFVVLVTDGGPTCSDAASCGVDACTVNMEEAASPGTFPACDQNFNCCEGFPAACLDDDATVAVIEALADEDVKTIVVSLAETTAYDQVFTQMALAGNAGDYDSVNGSGLSDLLSSISRELAASCTLRLDSPQNPDTVNVIIDGEVVALDPDNGWVWDTSTSPPSVLLVGDACDYVTNDATPSVQILLGCPTLVD